jgi:hypothetical protein
MALWLYLLSDEGGSWPVLKEAPLPSGLLLCGGKVLVELFGRFEDRAAAWTGFRRLEAFANADTRTSRNDRLEP